MSRNIDIAPKISKFVMGILTHIADTISIHALVAATALFVVSCTEETPELSQVAVIVAPGSQAEVTLASGEKTQYDITVSTINDYVASLQISSFDRQSGESILLRQTFDKSKAQLKFTFSAPELDADTADVKLYFLVADNLGNEATCTRTVKVINKMVSLPEKNGIVLYAPQSGLPDALSFSDPSRPFSLSDAPETELADIYMDSDENFTNITWKSQTETKFLRNNTFNYVEATASAINTVYRSSTRENSLSDIKINDIIIVGHGNNADGVFMVTNVITNPPCIQLSFKPIGRK